MGNLGKPVRKGGNDYCSVCGTVVAKGAHCPNGCPK